MAISASPFAATAIEPIASGTEVPTASTQMPITVALTFMMQPMREAHTTMNKHTMPIQTMDMAKVTG